MSNPITVLHSPTSPYARKVLSVILQAGLQDTIALKAVNPWDPDTDLPSQNPLGKIPAMILADGTALFDSPVICEYLDSLRQDGQSLFPPASDPNRWVVQCRAVAADGIMDASVEYRIETFMRPEALHHQPWLDRLIAQIDRTLDYLEDQSDEIAAAPLDISHIGLACALGYLDFRYADRPWRPNRPGLAGWYEVVSEEPFLKDTLPKD